MLIVKTSIDEFPVIESNYEKTEEQNAENLLIAFEVYKTQQNIGYEYLQPNTRILDEDGHEYVVKQLTNKPFSKSVVATHIFYELAGYRKEEYFAGYRSFNDFAFWLFNGSGWNFVNVDVSDVLTFNTFGNDNFLRLVQRLITKFDCEMEILPGKVVRFAKRIGQNNDKQYRFKNNIKEISQSIDTSNVRTRIKAIGADGLTVIYTSPLSSNPLFGVLDAEPITDESITDQAELLALAKSSLNDAPATNIDTSVLDTDGNVGDYVWVIHEEMDLEYQARILSKRTKRNYEESTVEIGNVKKRTIEDALIDQKEEVKANAEKAEADLEKLEEKTNEELAKLEVSDNEIRLTVQNTENTLRSEIVQTANSISLRVEEVNRSVASLEITATQIQSNVTNLQNYTQSSITQLSDNINLKVDKGGTITDINLSPGVATINASKINLNGAVMVNGSISGSTDIVVSNSAAVGNALYFGGFRGSFDFIEVSGGDMTFNSLGDFNFSGGNVYINGRKVMTE